MNARFVPVDDDDPAWDERVAHYGDLSLPQTGAYGAARAEQGAWRVERGIVERDGREVAATQVLLRALPILGGGLAWISRGPLAPDAEVLAALRRHFVDERGLYLRIAPPMPALIAAPGFRPAGAPGWSSAFVDLAPDPAVLRTGLEQKWRNGLNKAERSGARIESGTLEDFIAEYRGFVAGRGFATTVTPELLSALGRRMPLIAFRAMRDGTPLGSALIARYGATAEYLAGTLLDEGRAYNAGQLLLWHALTAMKSAGAARLDVGGMDAALTPKGIYDFKAGLGGIPYAHVEELEADKGDMRARLVRWRVRRARAP